MRFERIAPTLRCPHCGDSLTLTEKTLCCTNGHSFDIARAGYVNLSNGPEPANADTKAMLDARGRVHAAGIFTQVRDTVTALTHGRQAVLEAGSGTGEYLAAALGSDPAAIGLALDVSKAAARRCAHADPRIAAVITDVWQPLPVKDHSFDAVLAVFAPRNLPEFARALRRDGRFVAVTPRSGHLAGLRDSYGLLDIQHGKAEQIAAAAAEFFDLVDTRVVKYRVPVSEGLASDLIAMGPNAFHTLPESVTASVINIDVTVQSFRPILG